MADDLTETQKDKTTVARRTFLAGLLASALVPAIGVEDALAHRIGRRHRHIRRLRRRRNRVRRNRRKPFVLARKYQPQRVFYRSEYRRGTIVVDPRNHFLYLIESPIHARRYGVGVGRAGLAFKGKARIGRKAKWPRWTPTAGMIRREPHKYAKYANGVPGGPGNPLGARALYLYRGKRDTLYRIHGTTAPSSIGRSVSNGCIRMINDHVKDLYNRVPVGAPVVVI